MNRIINVLILDDNEVIASCIKKRLIRTSQFFADTIQLEIIPHYLQIDISNLEHAGEQIRLYVVDKQIQVLLLDRGFFELVDPNNLKDVLLNNEMLYYRSSTKPLKIAEILTHVNFTKIRSLKGVVIYTYDEASRLSEWFVSDAEIKQEIMSITGIPIVSIDVLLTNSEIYHLAKLQLYKETPCQIGEYSELGAKRDFMVYGLFLGELLFHRVVKIIQNKDTSLLASKQARLSIRLLILFTIFTFLSIGGNAIYAVAYERFSSNLGLILLSAIFAIVFPLLILLLRPQWIINLDEEE